MKKIILSVLILLTLLFAGFDYWVKTLHSSNLASREFVIQGASTQEKRDSLVDVGQNLQDAKIIGSKYYFYYYAWRNSLRGSILAGTYIIEPKSSLGEIAYLFTKGVIKEVRPEEISVTFKEGLTLLEMVDVVEESGLPAQEFKLLAQNPPKSIIEKYDYIPAGKSLEGFLFPDTYNFFPNADAQAIIDKMLAHFDKKVSPSMRQNIAAQGKTLFDVIILASIVEGEVVGDSDRGLVAGVFQNRLDIDMALQTDASIDYITGISEIKHTLDDLEIDSPYNTYLYPGLPPGPLNSPSLNSIIAAMNPTETEYLFFLSSVNEENLGETLFAETFEGHIINKAKSGL